MTMNSKLYREMEQTLEKNKQGLRILELLEERIAKLEKEQRSSFILGREQLLQYLITLREEGRN